MKKSIQLITFAFFILVFLSFVVYGQIKASEAQKNLEVARLAQQEAMQVAEMARQQAQDAAAQVRKAEAHSVNLMEQLKDCQSK